MVNGLSMFASNLHSRGRDESQYYLASRDHLPQFFGAQSQSLRSWLCTPKNLTTHFGVGSQHSASLLLLGASVLCGVDTCLLFLGANVSVSTALPYKNNNPQNKSIQLPWFWWWETMNILEVPRGKCDNTQNCGMLKSVLAR